MRAWIEAIDPGDIRQQVAAQHDASVKRLQEWIALPSIAAEDLNVQQGAEHMAKLAREAEISYATIAMVTGESIDELEHYRTHFLR